MTTMETVNCNANIASGIGVGSIRNNFSTLEDEINGWRSKIVERDGSIGSIPTRVYRGLYRAFSFPIWSAGVSEEDLTFVTRVPFRWDGVTNPHAYFISAPSAGETADDRYQFEFRWQTGDVGAVIPDGVEETLTDEVILVTGENTAWFAHILDFELTATKLVAGQNLQMNLTRIDATADEVTAEPVIFHWDMRWRMDKLTVDSASGY